MLNEPVKTGGQNAPTNLPDFTLHVIPDLILPHGHLRMFTVVSGEAKIQVDENEWLDVTLPAGAPYLVKIGTVYRARWRAGATPEGIWSFFCALGDDDINWLEKDELGQEWQINYDIPAPELEYDRA